MEMSQGNSLYSYLIQAKMSLFFRKMENKKAKQVLPESWNRGGG
jgi:hypothetical protein